MNSINSVTIIGNLTKDLDESNQMEFAFNANGTARANISIAVNRSRKQGDQWVDDPSYFTVVIYGKSAENLKPYFKKGTKVGVTGYLKQDRWQDKTTGQNRERVVIVADNVQLCGGNPNNNNGYAKQNMNGQNTNNPAYIENQARMSYQQPQQNYQPQNNFNSAPQNNGGFPENIPF